MSDDNNIEVKVSADSSGVSPGMQKSVDAIKEGVDNIKGHFEGFEHMLEGLRGKFLALTAVVAGGELFEKAIEQTREIVDESEKLALVMGVTTTEASEMRSAFDAVGATTQDVETAVGALTRTMKNSPENFAKLGISIRDANGNLRPMPELLLEVTDKFNGMSDGTAKNIAMSSLLGKQWQNMAPVLRLTSELMEEEKAKARELGLVVGEENVEANVKYRAAMADTKDVIEAMEKAVGDALMPILTQLGEWFSDIGPAAVFVIKEAIGALALVFWGLKMSVDVVVSFVKTIIQSLVIHVLSMADAVERALHLDFKGAQQAWKNGIEQIEDNAARNFDEITKKARETEEHLHNLFSKPTDVKMKIGTDAPDMTNDKSTQMLAGQFAVKRAMSEADLAQTKDQLGRAQSLYDDALAHNLISLRQYYDARLAIQTAGLDKEIDAKRKEIAQAQALEGQAAAKKTPEGDKEVLKFRAEIIKMTSDLTILENKRATAAVTNNQKMIDAEKKRADAIEQIDIDSRQKASEEDVAAAESRANMQFELGMISKEQLLEQDTQFENQRRDIARKALQDRLALEVGGPNDPIAVAQLNAQLEELERQHQSKLNKIRQQSTIQQKRYTTDMYSSMQQGFAQVIQSAMSGSMTLTSIFRNLCNVVLSAIEEMLAKMIAEWAINMIKSMVMSKTTAAGEIAANAGVAGAAATASAAAIPFYGWAIAPEAGAAAAAAAMSFEGLAAAEQGYDIPAGLNPLVQAHQKEMILPAKQADVIRDMADNGGSSRKMPDIHVHAMDSHDVKRSLQKGGTLHKVLTQLYRNGAIRPQN